MEPSSHTQSDHRKLRFSFLFFTMSLVILFSTLGTKIAKAGEESNGQQKYCICHKDSDHKKEMSSTIFDAKPAICVHLTQHNEDYPGFCEGGKVEDCHGFPAAPDDLCGEDECPNDPNKLLPGVCGCGIPDTDSDGDGTPDCHDSCKDNASKVNPGICGCNIADDDGDNDGTPDCIDKCPDNPDKVDPGVCGCEAADTNQDQDRSVD